MQSQQEAKNEKKKADAELTRQLSQILAAPDTRAEQPTSNMPYYIAGIAVVGLLLVLFSIGRTPKPAKQVVGNQ